MSEPRRWRTVAVEATGALAMLGLVGLFLLARLMGAHWNLFSVWLLVSAVVGTLARALAWWLDGFATRTRTAIAVGAVRTAAIVLGLVAIERAIVEVQLGDEKTSAVAWLVGAGALGIWHAWTPLLTRSVAGTLGYAVVLAVFAWDLTHAIRPRAEGVQVLRSPFDTPAVVFHGGRTPLINHHATFTTQADALDLVLAPEGSEVIGDPTTVAGWACYGAPLYAPGAGFVVAVSDDLPDLAPDTVLADQPIEGNHVSIEIGPDHYVFLAHLQQHSVPVEVGQWVDEGQLIGRCGNTGNTSQPHLHVQLQNKPMLDNDDPDLHTWPIAWRMEGHAEPVVAVRNDVILPTPSGRP